MFRRIGKRTRIGSGFRFLRDEAADEIFASRRVNRLFVLIEFDDFLALRVATAPHERPEPARPQQHRIASGRADEFRFDCRRFQVFHFRFGAVNQQCERIVEIPQQAHPIGLAFFHIVEFAFHICGERQVHYAGKVFYQLVVYFEAQFGRIKAFFAEFDVFTVTNGRNDIGVGTRSPDSLFFQCLDYCRFRVARRRLGEMLARVEFFQIERLVFRQRRKRRLFVVGHFFGVFALGVDAHEAVEFHDAAGRAKHVRSV